MGYLNETLKRASIKSLREYFLYGVNEDNYSAKSYEVRLKKVYDKWRDIVKKYDNSGEDSELYRTVNEAIIEHEHVYMELGLQAGFKLAKEIERGDEVQEDHEKYKEMYTSLFKDVTKAIEEFERAQKSAEEIYLES